MRERAWQNKKQYGIYIDKVLYTLNPLNNDKRPFKHNLMCSHNYYRLIAVCIPNNVVL